MNIWKSFLKMCGWKVEITAPRREKCVICVAPHTSNWDFIIGLAAYRSLGRKANFLMKEFWFFFPLGYLLRALGGIPVPKKRGSDLTASIIHDFGTRNYINLAVTPEGTRSRTDRWRRGFLYIAYGAKVPLQLGIIDYENSRVIIRDEYLLTGDPDADIAGIKKYYSNYANAARYPRKFSAGGENQTP